MDAYKSAHIISAVTNNLIFRLLGKFSFSQLLFLTEKSSIIIYTCECWWNLTFWGRVTSSFGGQHYRFCFCGMNQHKRQLSSSSSSESLNTFRIPKKVDTKKTPTKSEMESRSAATMTSPVKTEEAMDDVVVDSEVEDLEDNQLEHLEISAKGSLDKEEVNVAGSSGGASSWAEAAAGGRKVKKDYPFTLYVQKGTTKREPISKAHFTAFEKFLWKERFKLSQEDNEKIVIDFVAHSNGYGIVACVNQTSSNWVKKVTQGFKHGGEGTRAWSRWERSSAVIFSGWLGGSCFKDNDMKPNYVLSNILKLNSLQGNFEILSWEKKAGGCWISFEPRGPLVGKLQNMKRLNAGISTLVLHKRLRQERSEEEFLKFQEQKEQELLQKKSKAAGRRGPVAGGSL